MKNSKGITLVALVVTIVVLLILAGVSINLVLGENGLIKNAKEAKEKTETAEIEEKNQLNEITEELNRINDNVFVDEVKIPEGFYYVGGKKDTGLVISDSKVDYKKYDNVDVVGTDLEGNQFVWIPVSGVNEYKRRAYADNYDSNEIDEKTNSEKILNLKNQEEAYFTETIDEVEKQSVEKYKGYYIGRYEAGDAESTNKKQYRTENSTTENTISIKKGQIIYNWISNSEAKEISKNMYKSDKYITKLCSSYAWDSAIYFIEQKNTGYSSDSKEGNYLDTTFEYTDINGEKQNKKINDGISVTTGQTTAVCNIFDMGGNFWEWTSEIYSLTNLEYVNVGGSFRNNKNVFPAGRRGATSETGKSHIGFRVTLFMN